MKKEEVSLLSLKVSDLIVLLERLYGLEKRALRSVFGSDIYRYLCLGAAALMYSTKDEAEAVEERELANALSILIRSGVKGNLMRELHRLVDLGPEGYIDDYLKWIKQMMMAKVEQTQFMTSQLGTKFEPTAKGRAYRFISLNAMVHASDLTKAVVAFIASMLDKSNKKPDPDTFAEIEKVGKEMMRNPDWRNINVEAKRLKQMGFVDYIKGNIAFVLAGSGWERWVDMKRATRG